MTDHKGKSKQDKSEPRLRGVLRLIGGGRGLWMVLIFAVIVLIAVWLKVVRGGEDSTSDLATFVAKRGPLTISVLESGTIQARERITLRNEVEGRTSIISLVAEGTRVKAGELLVELDASTLKDAIIDQDIIVQKADASHIGAKENLAVVENQAESDIDVAKLTLEFAKQDLEQYKEGQYPNEIKAAEGKITLAQEELTRARETLKWSKTLYAKKYLSQTELTADELMEKRRAFDLELAQNDRDLLTNFTYQRNIAQLESDLRQATMALERTERKASADVIQAKADLRAKELEDKRQQEKLKKMKDQLGKAKIYAPTEGMVIYATTSGRRSMFDRREPLDIGVEVTERQDLIHLPTTASVKAEVDIHETSLEKVRVGLPTIITVDALPDEKFLGQVGHIAPLPDARSMWANPDLKVYNTDIYLEGNNSTLRTGMSCKAEIIVERYEDAVYIPVQAVLRVGREPTIYIVNGRGIEPRKVEIGLDNNRMVRIVSGLQEGEVVLLTPPLESGAVEPMYETAGAGAPGSTDTSDVMRQRINESLEKANGAKVEMPSRRSDDFTGRGAQGPRPAARPGAEERRPREGQGGRGGLSTEQAEKMRQRFRNMSPEERQKELERMRQRFQNMSPEERRKMQEQSQGTSQREGARSRQRGPERNQ